MEITTVVGCVNQCSYCPQEVFVAAYSERGGVTRMTFDTFRSCLERVPAREKIVFAGMSEPWMNPECTRMVQHAHARGHAVGVYTSLVGMGPDDVARLEGISFQGFSVHLPSLPSSEKIEVTSRYRATLQALLASGIGATWHAHGPAVPPEVSVPLRAAGIEVGYVKNHTRTGNLAKGADVEPECFLHGPLACRRHLRENVLLPNGDVILCCMDYGMRYVLGNLLEQTYEGIREGEALRAVEEALRTDGSDVPCRRCVFSNPVRRQRSQ